MALRSYQLTLAALGTLVAVIASTVGGPVAFFLTAPTWLGNMPFSIVHFGRTLGPVWASTVSMFSLHSVLDETRYLYRPESASLWDGWNSPYPNVRKVTILILSTIDTRQSAAHEEGWNMSKLEKISLKDRLATELRRKILTGALPPHSRVTEQDLADEYGVSRAVVRETMLVLELQGLITSVAYKGSEVASISRTEVAELLLPIRIHIEQFALKEGMPLFDADTFEAFDRVLAEMQRAIYNKDIEAFNEADMRFHAVIVDASPTDSARSIWDSIHPRIRMHFALQTGRTGALPEFLEDHRRLVDIFRTGDVNASVAAIKAHIIETNEPHLGVLDESVQA